MKKGSTVKLIVTKLSLEQIDSAFNCIGETCSYKGRTNLDKEKVDLFVVKDSKAFKKAKGSKEFIPFAHLLKPVVDKEYQYELAN